MEAKTKIVDLRQTTHSASLILFPRFLLDEGIALLKEGAGSAARFAPHLVSQEEAEEFDLSILSKVCYPNVPVIINCSFSGRPFNVL